MSWNNRQVGRSIPLPYVKGRNRSDNHFYIGNMSWQPETDERLPFTVVDNKLVAKND